VLSAPLDTNHYAFLNLENAATKVCPPLNQPNITACFSVKIKSYKMVQAQFLVATNLLKNTAIKVAISYAISYLKRKRRTLTKEQIMASNVRKITIENTYGKNFFSDCLFSLLL
jgi:hypothetical protein